MALAKKLDSIGLRISPENKEIIKYAAECNGQDLTSYMVSIALDQAKKDIVEHREIQSLILSRSDFNKVSEEIRNPSEPNSKLKAAFKAHKKTFNE